MSLRGEGVEVAEVAQDVASKLTPLDLAARAFTLSLWACRMLEVSLNHPRSPRT